MFDRPVRGSVSAYNWDRDYDDYTRQQTGGTTGISFLLGLDDYTRGSVFYTYDRTKITDVYTSSIDPIQDIAENKYLTSSMIFGIERNSKDKWWDTTKGSLNS
jgi:outer membrane protein insertion porin family